MADANDDEDDDKNNHYNNKQNCKRTTTHNIMIMMVTKRVRKQNIVLTIFKKHKNVFDLDKNNHDELCKRLCLIKRNSSRSTLLIGN